jgi:hypothetical protein
MSKYGRIEVRRFRILIVLAAALALIAGSTASAAGIKAKPWVYDPASLGIIESTWVSGEGLPDVGNANQALYLRKAGPTSTNAAAGASIDGVAGMTITSLAFEYRNEGHCGAGAPRFNLYTDNGTIFLGCAHGTQEDPDNGWTRVTFSELNYVVNGIDIVFDEGTDVGPGFVYLDNITINDTVIGKPGNA